MIPATIFDEIGAGLMEAKWNIGIHALSPKVFDPLKVERAGILA